MDGRFAFLWSLASISLLFCSKLEENSLSIIENIHLFFSGLVGGGRGEGGGRRSDKLHNAMTYSQLCNNLVL